MAKDEGKDSESNGNKGSDVSKTIIITIATGLWCFACGCCAGALWAGKKAVDIAEDII